MNSSGGGSVTVDIDQPQKLSRLLIFVKWLLAIPHYLALYVLGIVAIFAFFLAFVATLIGGSYPRALFDFCRVPALAAAADRLPVPADRQVPSVRVRGRPVLSSPTRG